jgi:translation initiation factor 2B subunit (eIF-2B alpha/beta/delta family)
MTDERFSFTWGLDLLNDLGYVRLYNFMLHYYAGLGMTRLEMLCLVHLVSYHYESPDGSSRPSLATIASQMGYSDTRHVYELINSLESKGFITVERRPGMTSIYSAHNFAKRCLDLWMRDQGAQKATRDETVRGTPDEIVRGGVTDSSPEEYEVTTLTKEEERMSDANSERNAAANPSSDGQPRGETDRPKSVSLGTGDAQRDAVDGRARSDRVSARDTVARELYRLVWPTLDWPEGQTKAAKQARQSAQIAADRVLERIGRANYQQALDACHLLLTEPTPAESKWLGGAQSVFAVVDSVTSKVDELRRKADYRQRTLERQALMFPDDADELEEPEAANEAMDAVEPVAELACPEAAAWTEIKAHLRLQLALASYLTWISDSVLVAVQNGGDHWLVRVTEDCGDWCNSRLGHLVNKTAERVVGRPVTVEFVGKAETWTQ